MPARRIARARSKLSVKKLDEIQEGIFMGENTNAQVAFKDCIDIQFSDEGDIQ